MNSILRISIIFLSLFCIFALSAHGQQIVQVRHAEHPTFSRMVFDWQEQVPYSINLTGNRLEITFEKDSAPVWDRMLNDPLKYMANPSYILEGGKLLVTLTVPQSGELKHFRLDNKIVFDLVMAEDIVATASAAPVVEEKPPEQNMVPAVTNNDGRLLVRAHQQRDNLRLSYHWPEAVNAAVFQRNQYLWVVFDRKSGAEQREIDLILGQRIISARQIDHPQMTILIYELAEGQHVKTQKVNLRWHIDIRDNAVAPTTPIITSHQRIAGNSEENFFFIVENASDPLMIEDPVVGDSLAIIAVKESSQGMLQSQKFAKFETLPTAQGIAVRLIADDLEIKSSRNGVSLLSDRGLALTQSQLSDALVTDGGARQFGDAKILDFPVWAKGPLHQGDYHANKHELLYLLSNATDADRGDLRWQLARFYLANGRNREAYGVMNVMLGDDPDLLESSAFRIVLGVTNILMRHFEEGEKLLRHKLFLAQEEAFLWRAVANSELGNHDLAFKNYKKGADILSLQDPADQIRFLLAAMRSAYAMDDRDFVKFSLDFLRNLPLNRSQLTEVDYWQAVIDRDEGNKLAAEESLRRLVDAGVRQTAAWATYDLINMDYEAGKINSIKAVDSLEKLRFAWRGDAFEMELLSRLGDLYVEQKAYNTALQTLKLAVTFFEKSSKTTELTQQMNQIYSDLFLNGGADNMEPLKAVALYSEFRELIPLGKNGDNMTRRLTDKLVTLDLLPEAAELLNYQVKFRLKGVAQSVVAGRLAMIYLLDSKPQDALKILRATRDSQIPADIQEQRTMIEARTLVQLGSFEEAEILIEKFNSPEANDMRTDIFWRSENWEKFIAHSRAMLNNRYEDEAALSPSERLAVLRLSVAYIINNDKAGAKSLRIDYKSHMDNGLYGDIFEVITAEKQSTDANLRRLTSSIASVSKLETFMESYKAEFSGNVAQN